MPSNLSFLAPSLIAVTLLAACGDDSGGEGGAGGGSTTGTTTSGTTTGATTSASGSTTSASSGTGGEGGAGGSGVGGEGGAGVESFSIDFRGDVGGEAFDCAADYVLGATQATSSITDFRFYVHDVRLIDAEGGEVALELEQDGLWQHENLALLDFEDRTGSCSNGTEETRSVVVGTAPAGDYVGLAFKLGVPESLNHLDNAAAPSPLNLTALFWAWTSGYKFLRVDAIAEGGAGPFNLHLGATGCVGDPALGEDVVCSNPNVAEIMIEDFDPASSVVVFDYADAVSQADLLVDGGGAPGCMSGAADPECAEVFPNLGLALETGLPSNPLPAAFHAE